MPYRDGDPTEAFEGKIHKKTAKAYIVEMTLGGKYFVPLSQIIGEPTEPDDEGNRTFEVTTWWWNKRHDFEAD